MKANTILFLTNFSASSAGLFIPILIKTFSGTDFDVGLTAFFTGTAVFISSYIFGRSADIYGRRIFLVLGLAACSFAFILQIFATTVFTLMLARAFVGFCAGIFPSALTAYVVEARKGIGKFTSFGSLGFSLGSIIAGIIASYFQIWHIFLLGSILYLVSLLIALTFHDIKRISFKIPLFPRKIIKQNMPVYAGVFIRHTGACAVWTIYPLYLETIGATNFWIGVIYAVNAFSQFCFMLLLDKWKSNLLIVLGIFCSGITFIGFVLSWHFYIILVFQVLLGFSWACLYVGSLKFITDRTEEKSTSVGLLFSTTSLSGILGPILGGTIAYFVGYRAVVCFAVVMCFTALCVFRATLKSQS